MSEGGEVLVIRRRVKEREGMPVRGPRESGEGKGARGRRDRMRHSNLGRE